jgi:hypothetical protein
VRTPQPARKYICGKESNGHTEHADSTNDCATKAREENTMGLDIYLGRKNYRLVWSS